ncbi:hypothetical protein N8317_04060 [Gammaproteobacteria bacterium]|nr:hypothetical protein [Gammaproteobacteria bacterium]
MNKSSNLKKDFAQRALWVNYRSSAIFPFFIGEREDTVLVFQNYWKWKSGISTVIANIFIRDPNGQLAFSDSIEIKTHNEISIKEIFKRSLDLNSGTIEIEVIGNKNLGYPFPAILCFYKSKNFVSTVHSAGRILNSNEDHKMSAWTESNFYSILDDKFTPFISIFNGQHVLKNKDLEIKIFRLPKKKLLLTKKISLNIASFGSKTIYINKILGGDEKKLIKNERFFIVFKHQNKGVFGRYVVGNYYKKENMHFSTHSFMSISGGGDIVSSKADSPLSSFLPAFNQKPLSLKLISYPTNLDAEVYFQAKESNLFEAAIKKYKIERSYNASKSAFEEEIFDDKFIKFYSMKKCPARLNISYNFSLPNSIHPTDIATGFKGNVYPGKTSHWGSILNAANWKTIFFLRNCSHSPKNTEAGNAIFSFFDNTNTFKKKIDVPAETCVTFELEKKIHFQKFLSWKCKSSVGTIEIFWVSYNEKNGAICGDHSF